MGRSDNTTDKTAGGGGVNSPTMGQETGVGHIRLGGRIKTNPPQLGAAVLGPGWGGGQGNHTDQGVWTDGDKGAGGGEPPTTRGVVSGTPGGGCMGPRVHRGDRCTATGSRGWVVNPPTTREVGPGTPGGSQGTQDIGQSMATLTVQRPGS